MLRRAGRQEQAKQIDARSMAHYEGVAAVAISPEARWNAAMVAGTKASMLGKWGDAERLYQQAVEAADIFGPQDKRMVRSLNSLAGAYRVQKKNAEAEQALRRALSILESAAEPDKTQIGAMLASLAGLVSSQGRLEEAEALFRRAIELYEGSLGPEHPMLMGPLQGLAEIARKLGHNEEADALAARAEQVRSNSQKH